MRRAKQHRFLTWRGLILPTAIGERCGRLYGRLGFRVRHYHIAIDSHRAISRLSLTFFAVAGCLCIGTAAEHFVASRLTISGIGRGAEDQAALRVARALDVTLRFAPHQRAAGFRNAGPAACFFWSPRAGGRNAVPIWIHCCALGMKPGNTKQLLG